MPDSRSIISDLFHRRIAGIGDKCAESGGNAKINKIISDKHRITYGSSPINTVVNTNTPSKIELPL